MKERNWYNQEQHKKALARYKKVVGLRDIMGLSMVEIAKVLGVCRPRAYQLYRRAKEVHEVVEATWTDNGTDSPYGEGGR